jgi:hypothetical protein
MKKLILSLLALATIATFAQDLDMRFIALMEWAEELSSKGKFWNDTCVEDKTKQGCAEFRAILNEQYTMFAESALRYSQNDDTCQGVLRVKIIRHQVAIALHNKECGGGDITPQCNTDRDKIKADAESIKKEMDACSNAKNEKI